MPTEFEKKLRGVLAPDPHQDPVDWLEHHVRNIPYSPQAGPFRIHNSPWLEEPLRALTDPEVQEIGALGCVQSGKSWLIEGASLIIPTLCPGPTLILQDIDRNASDFQETRLRVLWESIPAIKELIGPDGIPKTGAIQFRGNTAWVLGANNERNLQRRSIRFLLGDEVWLWGQGSLKDAMARTTAFRWQSKTVLVSQGGVEGDDWSQWFKTTDQRVWTFCCPACNHRQPYKWEQIIFPKEARTPEGWNLDTVRKGTTYQCESCKHQLEDSNRVRTELNKSGAYVATNPNAPKSRRGYHWNALCAQWGLSWGDLAVECIEAKKAFDDANPTARREFVQKRLAQTWREEADEVQIESSVGGYKTGEPWPEEGGFVRGKPKAGKELTDDDRALPDFIPLRFMGVDVQRRGFWWVIRSFSGDGRSRLHSFGYCFAWSELIDIHKKAGVHPANVFVDSGDQQDEVLAACAANGWVATRGDQRNEYAWKVRTPQGMKTEIRPYSPPVVELVGQRRCKRFYFSNLRLKDTLALLIRRGRHTRPDDVLDEYLKQMQSERRTVAAGGKPVWEQIDSRANHLWDCEVILMLPAMAWKLTGKAEQMVAEPEAEGDGADPA